MAKPLAFCDHCSTFTSKVLQGNTTGMRNHLRDAHQLVDPTPKQPAGETAPVPGTLHAHLKKMKDQVLPVEAFTKTLGQWYVIMLVEDGLSFHQIEKSRYHQASCHFMGHSHMKSHKAIKKHAFVEIEKMMAACKLQLKAEKAAGGGLSCVIDEWTSGSFRRYMSVCVTSSTKTYNLGLERCIGSMDSKRTVKVVQKRLKEYDINISDLVAVSSDGASVMKKAGREMNIIHAICLGK